MRIWIVLAVAGLTERIFWTFIAGKRTPEVTRAGLQVFWTRIVGGSFRRQRTGCGILRWETLTREERRDVKWALENQDKKN